jgi:uncharacterized protein YbaR (Trm112 family)
LPDQSEPQQPQPMDEWLLKLLACPACPQHYPLAFDEGKSVLLCHCGRYAFPVGTDGIPNLLVTDDKIVNPEADPSTCSPPTGAN